MPVEEFQTILRKHLPYAGEDPLTDSAVLADLGLDSLGTVRLLADLEDSFDTELPDEALTAETFRTAGSLRLAFGRS